MLSKKAEAIKINDLSEIKRSIGMWADRQTRKWGCRT